MNSPSPLRTAWTYFLHALSLRCPYCGKTPIFPALKKTKSLRDWFNPLDGCYRCGYPYEREPGYFLLATWAGCYGMGSLLGLCLYFFLDTKYHPPIFELLVIVLGPIIIFNLLFARHAKALFLAFDHFFDPHEKERREGDDDRGEDPSLPAIPPPQPQQALSYKPNIRKQRELSITK
jgi:uncharacterized protein (DUF983 family)